MQKNNSERSIRRSLSPKTVFQSFQTTNHSRDQTAAAKALAVSKEVVPNSTAPK
jgi:hypothetical protein